MKNTGISVLIYGILVCAGGVIGFLTAHSIASLIMGGLFGAALIVCATGILKNKSCAYYTSMALSGILSGFFIYRFLHTGKIMPAGLMAVLSLVILSILIANLSSVRKSKKI
jgi:uncharacterized membrane protein (UPF0136 family)